MDKYKLWNRCFSADNNIEITSTFDAYVKNLCERHSNNIPYIKAELQECICIIDDYIKSLKGYIDEEGIKLASMKITSIDTKMSKMIIIVSKKKIPLFNFLRNYVENIISDLLSNNPIIDTSINEIKKNEKSAKTSEIKKELLNYIDNKFKYDPDKKIYSRAEACEFLCISNRRLTTLLSELKIKPVSTAVKPYTFNIEELERYRKEEM
ncbi:hypothetical protein D0T84_21640 [Dysgonomonas sp. 521]|uniref:hypothetical protein n=1 Tax=Dysgonomonas sp. 521 TaxID=2302932 RepID=UPI0013CFFE15|nr:hypothetical protein [Dysgonomonas sp. 521]NDV97474.1 hypothetical protein [Dysgonomonas sp. 521]